MSDKNAVTPRGVSKHYSTLSRFNFDFEQSHHDEGQKIESVDVASGVIEDILDKVFLKMHLVQLEKIKMPFATNFTKEYFRKALKQTMF